MCRLRHNKREQEQHNEGRFLRVYCSSIFAPGKVSYCYSIRMKSKKQRQVFHETNKTKVDAGGERQTRYALDRAAFSIALSIFSSAFSLFTVRLVGRMSLSIERL